MAELFETFMIVSFGFSWPTSIIKSWKARTAKGKSVIFLCLVLFGYFCGITGKILTRNITYVFVFYVINFVMVGIDIILHFRNRKLDRLQKTGPG